MALLRENGLGRDSRTPTFSQTDVFALETSTWSGKRSELYLLLLKYNLHEVLDCVLDGLLTFDFETSTNKAINRECKKLKFEGQLVPMSFSISHKHNNEIETETYLIDDVNGCPYN